MVIAIIGTLASVVLASLNSARESAQYAAAAAEIDQLSKAIELHVIAGNQYPSGADTACGNGAEVVINSSHTGSYMQEISTDPWGNAYRWDGDYRCLDGTTGCPTGQDDSAAIRGVIMSCGPNGNCGYDRDNVVKVFCTR